MHPEASCARVPQKIGKQIAAMSGKNGFGMELNALHRELLVAHAHDFSVVRPGRYFEAMRQRIALNDQRMVAGRGERSRQAAEHAGIVMVDARYLAMHYLFGV